MKPIGSKKDAKENSYFFQSIGECHVGWMRIVEIMRQGRYVCRIEVVSRIGEIKKR